MPHLINFLKLVTCSYNLQLGFNCNKIFVYLTDIFMLLNCAFRYHYVILWSEFIKYVFILVFFYSNFKKKNSLINNQEDFFKVKIRPQSENDPLLPIP